MLLTIGSTVFDGEKNDYILDCVLGQGGFGCVYKAHRATDGNNFAIKTLLSSFTSQESLLSFQNEIRQTSLISSDHVIKYIYAHDGITYPDFPPYIIMEYADGGALTELIEEQKKQSMFSNEFLKNIFLQLSEGMLEISKSMVHRDIKPDNILICHDILKISDFGLSKMSGEHTRTLTFKGYGTARYVAPEAWNNDKNTIQMDIYSMGIVFYELATLQYPYPIKPDANVQECRNAHLFSSITNPSSINRDLPANMVSLIIRMLEKPTQKRFSDWNQVIAAINSLPLPTDELSDVVTNALSLRNCTDIRIQEEIAARQQQRQENEDFCKLIYSQYDRIILEPIREFIARFNSQYAGTNHMKLSPEEGYTGNVIFSQSIKTLSTEITIRTEILLKENHTRKVPVDRFFRDEGYRTESYIPQCEKRDVLAWSQISDKDGRGFNTLLLKAENELYGDWFVLRNTNSGLSRSSRAEPFGFTLDELPKEIVNLHVMHIYNLSLSPLKVTDIPNFVAEHI